jgi:hypothetical protein
VNAIAKLHAIGVEVADNAPGLRVILHFSAAEQPRFPRFIGPA